jgi:hypothetical protein
VSEVARGRHSMVNVSRQAESALGRVLDVHERVAPGAVLPGRDPGSRVLRDTAVLREHWMRDT